MLRIRQHDVNDLLQTPTLAFNLRHHSQRLDNREYFQTVRKRNGLSEDRPLPANLTLFVAPSGGALRPFTVTSWTSRPLTMEQPVLIPDFLTGQTTILLILRTRSRWLNDCKSTSPLYYAAKDSRFLNAAGHSLLSVQRVVNYVNDFESWTLTVKRHPGIKPNEITLRNAQEI